MFSSGGHWQEAMQQAAGCTIPQPLACQGTGLKTLWTSPVVTGKKAAYEDKSQQKPLVPTPQYRNAHLLCLELSLKTHSVS